MYNIDIKGGIEKALKSITVQDLNDSVLSPEQFQKFVDGLQDESKILSMARLQEMYSQVAKIDRMQFDGRVLEQGKNADGTQNIPGAAKPTFKTNELVAHELVAVTGLYDDAARRNIMKKNLENYLITLFSKQVAFDLAEYCLWANTASSDPFLKKTNGWIELAANKLYGQGTEADFNPTDIFSIFNSMIQAMPKRAIRNRSEVVFHVGFEIEDALRDAYANRGTDLGDLALTTNGTLTYKGFPVVYDPAMDAYPDDTGRAVLFTNPKNLVYGVFHRVTIEADRVPKERKTDFVLTFEGDANYDNEEAAVVAYLDKAKPSA
ncbi:Phage capsid family protein [Aneurinibacillus thermoaerophilus]|uniref:Phage capsid family protein n=1 Tax=Aneurinibacillus thermoaerophilus TaxID=143495 RepID=A0A1G7WPS3_ANETH|nr:phage major capsid protein [Aneurinibacillus thermoaerophilus]SDG73985.1 Phage capsid family protein [Aneurinibacillus thermoaerophilus]